MPLVEASGNLLDAPVDALVNPVNTVGVMGKGLALQFKQAFPTNFAAYATACARNEVRIGEVFVHRTDVLQPRYILNVPTKKHWREPSSLEDVRAGIEALVATVRELQIPSVAVPRLGCGEGGLSFEVVRPLIVDAFAKLHDVDLHLYGEAFEPAPTVVNRHHYRNGLPQSAIYIGRGTPLGNPYTMAEHGERALDLYRRWLWAKIRSHDPSVMAALRQIGSRSLLVCSCKPRPCHGDVVVKAWLWLREQGRARAGLVLSDP